ncbi:hypothetical protein ACE193_18260 [Bernardetia sp. OM2101]|uniref:hypothetical protein n=1 Tax=Bernardetia sp. OM2101 TaxID=3344876 RepID=UPI0035CF7B4F
MLPLLVLSSCKDDDDSTPQNDKNDDVFELAIRRVNTGVSISEFTSARDTFVAKLMTEKGTSNDREVQPFFNYLGSDLSLDSVYIGLTQYEDEATYNSLGQSLSSSTEAQTFFATFTPIIFEALQPLDEYKPVDLGTVAPLGTGQVLEIAVRDLSTYSSFNQADYETARDAFLTKLSQQDGFVKEIQWKSVLNPNIVVGMTVYESQQAVIAINSDAAFTGSSATQTFIGNYPPSVFGTLNTVLK